MHEQFRTLHLLEAKCLVGDLEEDLDSIHGRHNRLGQHASQPASDYSLQSDHDIIAVVLYTYTYQVYYNTTAVGTTDAEATHHEQN